MSFLGWMAVGGALLLLMALSSAYIRKLPVTTSIVYLGVGVLAGPAVLGLLVIDVAHDSVWLLRLTEIAVIASLFVSGLKLRLPLRDRAWRAPLRLAGPAMICTIAGVAALLHGVAGLSWPVAMIAAAVLAPTDPVLAGEVAVNEAADEDRMRYALSGEAGLNDGSAFPFVVFGLSWLETGALGSWIGPWALSRVLWAVPAGLLTGYVCGRLVGRLGIGLRQRQRDLHAPSDFLCLAVIALGYVAAEAIHAWGFLAVFAAGVGMRHAERHVSRESPHPDHRPAAAATPDAHPPAEEVVPGHPREEDLAEPTVAAGVLVNETLIFGDTLERLLEVVLVVIVGVLLVPSFSVAGLLLAAALIVLVRPAAVAVALLGTPVSRDQRRLLGWFGIRGIGSLYYLTYALGHGLTGDSGDQVISLVVTVVAVSIVVHGISGQPLLARYEARLRDASRDASSLRDARQIAQT
jgi:NhaP-type Na+/H+ or K+/H+ antiporter